MKTRQLCWRVFAFGFEDEQNSFLTATHTLGLGTAMDSNFLSRYLKGKVSDSIANDYTEADLERRKVDFLLDEYASADASDAKRIFGLDAGIDAYEVGEDEDGNAIISIWQLSGPEVARIQEGAVLAPPNKKLDHDFSNLVDGMLKRQRHMSDAAAAAITLISDALSKANSAGKEASVTIHVLSLYNVSEEAKGKLVGTAEARFDGVFPKGMTVSISCKVHGLSDYAAGEAGLSGAGPQMEDLKMTLASPSAIATYNSGGTAYLVFARPTELLAYYMEHGAAILHTNARFFLGKGKATANKAIEMSAQNADTATRFHELNNGIVMTCASVNIAETNDGNQKILRLKNPQVVNGGQTLHTLTEVWRGEAKGKASAIKNLVLPIKIIVLETTGTTPEARITRAAEIAQASNTQAALSQRALASYAGVNAQLQRAFAAHQPRWFFEKTDGEWSAFRRMSPEHRKLITGVKVVDEFQYKEPSAGTRVTSRILRNSQLLEGLLSGYGCFDDASKKRMFDGEVHPAVLNSVLTAQDWSGFAEDKDPRRTYDAFKIDYPGEPRNVSEVSFFMLAWLLFRSVRALSLSEKPAQEWAMQYWTANNLGGPFKDYNAWLQHSKNDPNAQVFEWAEHVANAMQKPVVFEMLRLLTKRYGGLSEETSKKILTLPQFAALHKGNPVERTLDAKKCRESIVGNPTGPIYTLYQLCRNACGIVFQSDEEAIRNMGTKQQTLLGAEWVRKLSTQVDALAGNIEVMKMKLLAGVSFAHKDLMNALPDLDKRDVPKHGQREQSAETKKKRAGKKSKVARTGRH